LLWRPEPKNWKRNTAFGILGLSLSYALLFYISTRVEVTKLFVFYFPVLFRNDSRFFFISDLFCFFVCVNSSHCCLFYFVAASTTTNLSNFHSTLVKTSVRGWSRLSSEVGRMETSQKTTLETDNSNCWRSRRMKIFKIAFLLIDQLMWQNNINININIKLHFRFSHFLGYSQSLDVSLCLFVYRLTKLFLMMFDVNFLFVILTCVSFIFEVFLNVVIIPHNHTHTLSHTITHYHTHTITHYHTHTLSHTLSHTHTHTITHTLSHTVSFIISCAVNILSYFSTCSRTMKIFIVNE
jgi:hypothetical protein